MQEHYNLTTSQWILLQNQGVTMKDLFYGVNDFKADVAPVSKISLMHYADTHGDFLERKKKSKLDLVAVKIFDNLSIPEKVEIGEYLNWLEAN